MNIFSKAVIVAAGLSSRLYPLTLNLPKGLLEIADETILKRSVRLLREQGIEEILTVVGCQKNLIKKALGSDSHYQFNPFFAETNNMGSLWFAKEWVNNDPFIYLHGDLIYAPQLLGKLIKATFEDAALLVDPGPTDKEAMKVRIESERFVESNKEIPVDQADGEWVGIAAFKHPHILFDKVELLLEQKHFQVYDTFAFTEMAREGSCFSIIPTNGYSWVEIDDESDLNRARKLFS